MDLDKVVRAQPAVAQRRVTALKVIAWVLGALAFILVGMAAVGLMLPVKHRVIGRTKLAATPAEIYALITDVARFPEWRSGITSVEVLPSSGKPMYRESGNDGNIAYAVEHAVPNERLVTRIADPDLPFGGQWTFTLRATSDGMEIQIAEEGEVYNPIFRFMSRFIFGHTRSIERYLGDLERRVGQR